MSFPIQQGLFQFDLIDYYAILGVSIDADREAIRERYLKIAYKLHPDTCKTASAKERDLANQILSKFVNPAYEQLSRDIPRQEFRLIIAQIGKGAAAELSKITVASEAAQKLTRSTANHELAYQKLVQSLAIDQYTALENSYQKIAQLSELNLVYLMLTEGQGNQKALKNPVAQHVAAAPTEPADTAAPPRESSLDAYIRRARTALDRKDPAGAVRELRDAIRMDPENSTGHALLGLAYLRQNQLSMARVHINRAWKANPQEPTVIEAKRELDKVIRPNIEMQDEKGRKNASGDRPKEGGFWSIFGGKKNSK
ncbi:J domain-containing protein [Pannus brasiliensis CCIBt3594]|uniref:J domain-containing protein n=1 Tax=Pannus brasiliensis CCIBt3594 TaxID=1427578 RepID=A0AAW9R050_9CHRO